MRKINKFIFGTLLTVSSLNAEIVDYIYDTKSLVAIESGYSISNNDNDSSKINFGLKLGAESNEYRIFIGARRHNRELDKSIYTYGVDFQYIFNFSQYANMYIGVNGGSANIVNEDEKRVYEVYYGGDIGFNIHANKLIDVEIGSKIIKIEETKSISYGYISLIIKYKMD